MHKKLANILLSTLFLLCLTPAVYAVDSPHQAALGCTGCHVDVMNNALANINGINNLCLSCHNPAMITKSFSTKDLANPFGSTNLGVYNGGQLQTSHNWAAPPVAPMAGAAMPTSSTMTGLRTYDVNTANPVPLISCSSCHDQHSYTGKPGVPAKLLRLPMNSDQLCLDCHAARNTRDHLTGTHPVNFTYTSATSKVKLKPGEYNLNPVNANPANPTSAMNLPGGKVLCSTCHAPHFADSNSATLDNYSASHAGQLTASQGYLLRTDMRGATATDVNICMNCHASKLAHNNKGQNVQCADCHAGHVDAGDGTAPNVWLVRRYMNYSGGVKIDSYRRMVLNQAVGSQSNWAGPFGVCQSCHVVPAPGGAYPSEHASTDPDVCRSCHSHSSKSGSFAANCRGCHGFPPAQDVAGGPDGYAVNGSFNYKNSGVFKVEATTPHTAHAGSGVYQFACSECHAGNKHGTGNFQQVFIAKTGIMAASNGVTPQYDPTGAGTCSVYCHSNGVPRGMAFAAKAVSWDMGKGTIIGAASECVSCHDGVVGTINTLNTNAHRKHVSNDGVTGRGFTCNICHADTATSNTAINDPSKHVNGSKDLAFSGIAAGSTFNATDASCVTYCHTNGNGGAPNYAAFNWTTPAGTLGCTGCHGSVSTSSSPIATGKHSAHTNAAINTSLGTGNEIGCAECHAKTLSSNTAFSNMANHVNGMKDYSGGRAGRYNATTKQCSNVYCHSNGNKGALVYNNPAAWNSSVSYGCNGCHGTTSPIGAPDYPNGGSGTVTANSHNAHTAGYADTSVCANCHATTASTTGGKLANNSTHLNNVVNVSFNPTVAGANITFDPATGTCSNIACHGNGSAQWGSKAGCLACHALPIGKRAAIGAQFNGNSHHVQGVSVTGEHCYQCHWEANSDGSINRAYHHSAVTGSPVELVIYGAGARPAAYTPGVTAVQYTANGTRTEMAKINAVCLGCHSDQNKATQPFGDGKTPSVYAWDANSIGSKYSDMTTTPWGKYSGNNTTPKDKLAKAFSAHGNAVANKGGWDSTETWTDRGTTANVLCFDCHNSHGSNVAGVTTSYVSATTNGGLLKETVANVGGYSVTYKPLAGGSVAEHNAYNPGAALCFDCHMKGSAVDTPWGYNTTFGSSQQIMGYLDSAYFGNGIFGKQSRYAYKGTTPNMGGHFGASSALSASAAHQIGGLCTPCHDPHGVSPTMGANMKYGVPLLKGTWVTSPYKEDVTTADNQNYIASAAVGYVGDYEGPTRSQAILDARKAAAQSFKIDQNTFSTTITNYNAAVTGVTEADSQFAGLCLNCHTKANLTNGTTHAWKDKNRIHEAVKGWKTANGTIQHNYTCSKCHAPHNASLPRLMISNCFDSKHRGRVGEQTNPVTSGSYRKNGYGSGQIGGRYTAAVGERANVTYSNQYTCHENNETTQKWNNVTQWTTSSLAAPPAAPVLIAEANATCSGSCATTLQWNASSSPSGAAVQYLVQVSSSSAFTTVNFSSGWISTTSYTPTLTAGTWYWRVQARDSVTTSKVSPWSAVGSFTLSAPVTPTAPTVPTLVAEPDSTCSGSCATALAWNASTATGGSVEYSVQVSSSSSFSTVNFSSGWITATSYTPTLGTGTWYWRVQARNASSTSLVSAWSAVDSFVLAAPVTSTNPPTAPTLVAEPDATCSSSSGCSYQLVWNASSNPSGNAVQYLVQVSKYSDFSSVYASSSWQSSTSWTKTLGTGTWYWRVQARDASVTSRVSSWSAVDSFVVSN